MVRAEEVMDMKRDIITLWTDMLKARKLERELMADMTVTLEEAPAAA